MSQHAPPDRRRPSPPRCLLLLVALLFAWGVACGGSGAAPAAPQAVLEMPTAVEESHAVDEPPALLAPPAPIFPAPAAWAPAPRPRNVLPPAPVINGRAAVVVDEASGAVLYDRDARVALPPASLTKIATLILALESGRLDEWVDVDVDSTTMRGSTVMGLLPGDRFPLRDLLYGLMLPSGNDAALAIGRFVAGSDAAFVFQMNALLTRLGLRDSHFVNPHGLGGGNHVASAYDLAMLSRYGMSLPGFREIVTTGAWTARGSRTIPLANINSFLYSYAGADGVKTGHTRSAGSTLAASATRDGHGLYAVVLNSPSRELDAARLLSWAFGNLTWSEE